MKLAFEREEGVARRSLRRARVLLPLARGVAQVFLDPIEVHLRRALLPDARRNDNLVIEDGSVDERVGRRQT